MAEPYYANFQSALPWRGLVHFWYWGSGRAPTPAYEQDG